MSRCRDRYSVLRYKSQLTRTGKKGKVVVKKDRAWQRACSRCFDVFDVFDTRPLIGSALVITEFRVVTLVLA